MKCLRCGYCCTKYDVAILVDPDKGVDDSNITVKRSGERCMHLRGDKPGDYSCAIHDHPNYKHTPCFEFSQLEDDVNTPCRIGVHFFPKTIPIGISHDV